MIKLYHNPRCSKSRAGLKYLEDKNVEFETIKYLDENLRFETLKDLIKKLGIEPIELIRKQEKDWKDNFKGRDLSNEEIIQAMVDFPKLIERPIIVNDDTAVVGRPTEKIDELF